MMNRVTLIGNLGKDPEVKKTQNSWVARMSVATTDGKDGANKETQWHTISLWGKLAERANVVFKKGDLVYLEGTLKYRQHEGKYYTEIATFHVSRILKSDQIAMARAQTQAPATEASSAADVLGLMDDVPF